MFGMARGGESGIELRGGGVRGEERGGVIRLKDC